MRTLKYTLIVAALALQASLAAAQTVGSGGGQVTMQAIVAALGVKCDYCHVRNAPGAQPAQAQAQPGQPPSHLEIARNMIAMMKDLNERMLPAATGKEAVANLRIQCVTCHRGVAIPGQLSDIMTQTAIKAGGEAAVAQYRDFRKVYYGRQSYDFGEDTLINASAPLATGKPDEAVALLKLNLEFYPQSVRTYTQLAFTYTRKLDDDAAIAALEKALEINPDNSVVKGQLEQLKSYRRKQ
jgi:tetratricopeptide (TPR) repeat protein